MAVWSWGVFKGRHAGHGIYWRGQYNVEGDGAFRTIAEARAAIDTANAAWAERDRMERESKAASGKCLVGRRTGEGATIATPDGDVVFATMWEFRREVFKLEDTYQREIVWL